jgi:sugar lactone lactonase YvrE
LDDAGNVYVADVLNNAIRKIDPNGNVSTVAGNGDAGLVNGDGGRFSPVAFDNPGGVALDATGNLYVADVENNVIRKIDPNGNVTTFAGSGMPYAYLDGPAETAEFCSLKDVATDLAGNIYVADGCNDDIRKVYP